MSWFRNSTITDSFKYSRAIKHSRTAHSKSISTQPLWRVFLYLRHYPKYIILCFLFDLLSVLFNLSSFVFIVPFVELLFGGARSASPHTFSLNQHDLSEWLDWQLCQWSSAHGLFFCLVAIALAFLLCSFLSNLFRFLSTWCVSPVRNGVVERLRNDIFHKITILPVAYFKRQRSGDLLSRMSNDIADVEWSIVSSIQSFLKSPVNIIVFSATLLFISPALFLYFLLVAPVLLFLVGVVGKSLKRNSLKGQNKLGSLFSLLEENIAGIRVVKAFGCESRQTLRFSDALRDYTRRMNRVVRLKELSSPLSEMLGTVAMAAILVIGGTYVISGRMHASVFILFVVVFARLIPPVQALVRAYNSMLKGNASARRIMEVLSADEVVLEAPDAIAVTSFNNEIRYSDISFSYDDDVSTSILSHIDLVVPKGKVVALVGHSGSGKTTLVDLLPRFYDPTSGEVQIDGIDLRRLNIASLRALVSIVTQDCILFNDTVANNIAFGNATATPESIRRAAQLACADEFIESLPDGYDTIVGDRGITLSGGQRQRISIARALLKDAPILILDEATAALDNDSERQVQAALHTLMQNRTTIVIAHRLSTIRNADVIHVMDHGSIVESGTHDQLLALNGAYARLLSPQI